MASAEVPGRTPKTPARAATRRDASWGLLAGRDGIVPRPRQTGKGAATGVTDGLTGTAQLTCLVRRLTYQCSSAPPMWNPSVGMPAVALPLRKKTQNSLLSVR